MKLGRFVVVLTIAGSFSGTWACGRSSLALVDDVGDVGDVGDERAPTCSGGTGPGLTNCGANRESCCASLEVEGGTYDRTSLPTFGDPAIVSSFRLDKYDVTVGRFRRFVSAWHRGAGYTPSAGSGKHLHLNEGKGLANSAAPGTYERGWAASDDVSVAPTNDNLMASCDDPTYAMWTPSVGKNENLPINCVTWQEAYAFCIWDGGFLPSEAEWGYAATGGSEQREYPWGSVDPGTTDEYAIYDCDYPSGSGGPNPGLRSCTGGASAAPVGTATLGAGRWGQLDLVGNVAEWNMDWYTDYVNPCTDCAYLTEPFFGERVYRGTFFADAQGGLSSGERGLLPPEDAGRYVEVGFRCARTP